MNVGGRRKRMRNHKGTAKAWGEGAREPSIASGEIRHARGGGYVPDTPCLNICQSFPLSPTGNSSVPKWFSVLTA